MADAKLKAIAEYDGHRLDAGMAASSRAVSQSAQNVEGRFLKLGATLKDFRREQMAQGRQARFLADEISSIIPGAEGAGGSLRGLLGIFVEATAGGLSLGLAFEAVKFGLEAVNASAKEAADFQKILADAHTKATASLNEYLDAARQQTEGDRLGAQVTRELTAEQAKRVAEINKLGRALVEERSTEMQILLLESGAGDANAYVTRELEKRQAATWKKIDAIRAEIAAERDMASVYAEEAAAARQLDFAKKALDASADKEAEKARDRAKKRKEMLKDLAEDDAKRSDERREAQRKAMQEQDVNATRLLLGPLMSVAPPPMRESSAADLMKENGVDAEAATEQAKRMTKAMAESRVAAQQLASTISGQLGNALSSVLLHGQNVTDALKGFFTSMAEMFIQKVAEMIAQWLVFRALTGLGLGSFLGPAGGFIGSGVVALASGTAYVPRDMFAQIHEGEAVLPKPMAEEWRQGGDAGPRVAISFHSTYLDRRGLDAFVDQAEGRLLKVMDRAARNRRG